MGPALDREAVTHAQKEVTSVAPVLELARPASPTAIAAFTATSGAPAPPATPLPTNEVGSGELCSPSMPRHSQVSGVDAAQAITQPAAPAAAPAAATASVSLLDQSKQSLHFFGHFVCQPTIKRNRLDRRANRCI